MAESITLGDPTVSGPANPGDGEADFDIPLSPGPSPDWQAAFHKNNLDRVPVTFHAEGSQLIVLRVRCSSFDLEQFLTSIRVAARSANEDRGPNPAA